MKESIFVWLQTLSEKQVYPLMEDLLRAMGYQRVSTTHGPLEFGRDLVFLEIDKLGREIWRGVQVKREAPSGSLTSEDGIRTIVSQCEAAVDTPFHLPSGDTVYLSEVWLVYTSAVGEHAKASIAGKLKARLPVYIIDGPHLGDLVAQYLPNLLASKSQPIDDYLERLLTFSNSIEEYIRIRLATKFSLADVFIEPQVSVRVMPRELVEQLLPLNTTVGLELLQENIDFLLRLASRRLVPAALHFRTAEALTRIDAVLRVFSTLPWYSKKRQANLRLVRALSKLVGIDTFALGSTGLLPARYKRETCEITQEILRELEPAFLQLKNAERLTEIFRSKDKSLSYNLVSIDKQGDATLTHKGTLEIAKYSELHPLIEFRLLQESPQFSRQRASAKLRDLSFFWRGESAQDPSMVSDSPIELLSEGEDFYRRLGRARQAREQFFASLEAAYRSSIDENESMTQIALEAARRIAYMPIISEAEEPALEERLNKARSILEQISAEFMAFHTVLIDRFGSTYELLGSGDGLTASSALNAWPSLMELDQLSRFAAEFYGASRERYDELKFSGLEVSDTVPRLALLGDLGLGKTTLLKQIARKAVGRFESTQSTPLPIFVRLATVSEMPGEPLERIFLRHSEGIAPTKDDISERPILWLLDGFDEIQSVSLRTRIAGWILDASSECRFIVSSRPFAIPQYLPSTLSVSLSPLSIESIERFVRTYPWDDKKQAEALLSGLQSVPELMKLASTPLLLTLIIVLAQAQGPEKLPKTREGLYHLLLDLFLGEWDVAKGLRKTQTIADEQMRAKILRRTAFALYAARKRSFSREEFVDTVVRVRGPYSLEVDSAVKFFADLVRDCLLVPLSRNTFGFFHFSIHEYLVAVELCDDTSLNRVLDAVKEFFKFGGWWEEVLVFYASVKRDIAGVLAAVTKRWNLAVRPRFFGRNPLGRVWGVGRGLELAE